MTDPRLQSVHLDGQPRREQFREARRVLHASLGTQTIAAAGDCAFLADDDAFDGPTLAGPLPPASPLATRFACYLKDGGNVYPLHVGMNSVGRLPDNDVVVRDECVSRRHCAVLVHSDFRCELHDVASKNGTVLNGRKIAGPTRIQSGDQITLCNKKLTFVLTDTAAPVAG